MPACRAMRPEREGSGELLRVRLRDRPGAIGWRKYVESYSISAECTSLSFSSLAFDLASVTLFVQWLCKNHRKPFGLHKTACR